MSTDYNAEVEEAKANDLPSYVDADHLLYLDNLRESGVTNMFGAGEYLEREFGIDRQHAKSVLMYWMDTFAERHNMK